MQSDAHTSKAFDAELEHIRSQLLEMGGLVEDQIRDAVQALENADLALVDHVIDSEFRVNQLERDIDEACTQVIARRSPAAGDLRFLIMAYKTLTDLERIGDEAKKIALIAGGPHVHDRFVAGYPKIRLMSGTVIEMLRRALDGIGRLEAQDVPEVVRQDAEVNDSFRSILRQLLTYMIEDPRTISVSLDWVVIAKALERIGDHAKNISEYVIYMIKGTDVRHLPIEELEAAAKA